MLGKILYFGASISHLTDERIYTLSSYPQVIWELVEVGLDYKTL